MSPDYCPRREILKEFTEERSRLKKAARRAREKLARARKIAAAIHCHRALLDGLNSGKLVRVRHEYGAGFGWNQQVRKDAGTAAGRGCSK